MIEVSLALAVVGIAMVSILGLFAVGLNAARDATDDDTAAQIIQAIIADRQRSPYTSPTPAISATSFAIPALDSLNTYTLYFPKRGGVPTISPVANASYFQVDIKKRPGLHANFSDLAVLDLRVSWPAAAADINQRTVYFYTTAIGRR